VRGLQAAAELLIGHRFWLCREDFVEFFIELGVRADGTVTAFLDWEEAARALAAGRLACSDSQGRVLAIAASLAEDIPVGLRDVLCGLEAADLSRVAGAVLRAGGHRGALEAVRGERPDSTGGPVSW
jgi:hypothetical protein